ncbi:TonB-dependent receptor domain-containing protein [Soonwooa sp.]|uniref:TonB-dependent receptor domain-containing protein n=1 Tax=Soonwooa sp. TaxID=1938592 RepID=UPI0035AF1CB2
MNQALFLTNINHPVIATLDANQNIYFANQDQPVVSKGFDIYLKGSINDWELYLGYTFTIAKYKFQEGNQIIPLTPKNRAAMTVVKDFNGSWKFGVEASYNGTQYRMDYSKTLDYLFVAAMISKDLGEHFTVALNCENLFDYRQSRKEIYILEVL